MPHGRTRAGVDCWGLVRLWYAEQLGIELDSYSESYQSIKDRESIDGIVAEESKTWLRQQQPQTHDVVVWKIGPHWSHVGVVVAPRRFLHIFGKTGSVIERLDSLRWSARERSYYRLRSR